jgi:hypothetical protein
MQRVGTHRNSKVQELADKFAGWDRLMVSIVFDLDTEDGLAGLWS